MGYDNSKFLFVLYLDRSYVTNHKCRATVVLGIFVDSWLFVFTTGILKYGVDLNSSWNVCSAALFLCLTFYVITKIVSYFSFELVFLFQVPRVSWLM